MILPPPPTHTHTAQDISGVFGMYSSQDQQETFDVEDEEAAAVWDLDELEIERLRAAPSQSQPESGGVSGLVGGSTPAGGIDGGGLFQGRRGMSARCW